MERRLLLRKHRLPFLVQFYSRARVAAGGFTLVEVVLALGIVSFALVGILSMFPIALDTAKDSKNETRVTVIAQNIFSDLRASPPNNSIVLLKQPNSASDYNDINYVSRSPLSGFVTRYIAYDFEGRPLQSVSSNDFNGSYNNPQVGFLASVSTNASPQTGLARVDVTIVSPPQAGSASTSRKASFFTTYLPTQ